MKINSLTKHHEEQFLLQQIKSQYDVDGLDGRILSLKHFIEENKNESEDLQIQSQVIFEKSQSRGRELQKLLDETQNQLQKSDKALRDNEVKVSTQSSRIQTLAD